MNQEVQKKDTLRKGSDMVLQFRPISEIIRLFVRPEIDKRLLEGKLDKDSPPIEIYQFLAYQKKDTSVITPVVQFNGEFNMTYRVQLKEPKNYPVGTMIGLNDIKLDECFILPPKHDGKPCAYFYYNVNFLTPFMVFDCSPNVPDMTEESLNELRMRYPIEAFFKNINFVEAIKPYEKMQLLRNKHWPPNPAYYPRVFSQIHKDSNIVNEAKLIDIFREIYSDDYWESRFEFWEVINLFPKQLEYVKKAVERHMEEDFISSIYVICPQFEGIISDYLDQYSTRDFQKNLDTLERLILSRNILLFPRKFINNIFEFLRSGTFWVDTDDIDDPTTMPNRHGILHGKFTQFETEELSLKFLILLDSLAFILVSDRMAMGTL